MRSRSDSRCRDGSSSRGPRGGATPDPKKRSGRARFEDLADVDAVVAQPVGYATEVVVPLAVAQQRPLHLLAAPVEPRHHRPYGNRGNVWFISYGYEDGKPDIEEQYMLPFLPTVGVNFTF